MSTRVSQVYGEGKHCHWHGWTECFEGDWLYLDVKVNRDEQMAVTVNDDKKTEVQARTLFVRMPLDVFDQIARQYVQRKNQEAALDAQIRAEWAAFEAGTGLCARCCRHGDGSQTGLTPHCTSCGGTGKAKTKEEEA